MNVLLIMSDEHRRDAMGCAGHPLVRTPNLDRLAGRGARFANAYCNSPLCGPSRASFAAGQYVHQTGCWDHGKRYAGRPESWGGRLNRHGVAVTTIGKLDYEEGADTGFQDQRCTVARKSSSAAVPPRGRPAAPGSFSRRVLEEAGAGDRWTAQTMRETEAAVRYLREEAPGRKRPWALWLNYLPPHFPLIAPEPYYKLYPLDRIELPYDSPSANRHPALEELRAYINLPVLEEEQVRTARAAYYGLCSFVDAQIGLVLDALEAGGQAEDTLVIYTSDHGEHLGDHGLWWKSSFYEQAAGVPLIMAGPGISRSVVESPVSLVDVTATIAEAAGVEPDPGWSGRSLLGVVRGEVETGERTAFSEYHAHGSSGSSFMLRKGRCKYVYYPGLPPMLFDLEADPLELCNAADDPAYAETKAELHRELLRIADPDMINDSVNEESRLRLRQPAIPRQGEIR